MSNHALSWGNQGNAEQVSPGNSVELAGLHAREVVRSAERELQELLQRRAEIMKRIGTIKQTLAGLVKIFGESLLGEELLSVLEHKELQRQPGPTHACRQTLMEAETPLSPRDVCALLLQNFPGLLERHKDPVASVTTVLGRLVEYAEARCFLNDHGRRVWEWVTDEEDPALRLLRHNLPAEENHAG